MRNKNFNKFKYIIIAALLILVCAFGFAMLSNNRQVNFDKANAEISTLNADTLYKVDIGKTWTGTTYPYVTNTSRISFAQSFTFIKNGVEFNGDFIYVDFSYTSSTSKSITFSFYKAQNTYPAYILMMGTGTKKCNAYYATSQSNNTTLTTNDNLQLKLNNSISNSFTQQAKSNLMYVLNNDTYNITSNITNGIATPNPASFPSLGGTIQITPNSGYTYPDNITVSSGMPAPSYTYNNSTGIITVTSVGADFSITATCPEIPYNLIVNVTHGYWDTAGGYTPSGITQSGMNIYIHPATYYTYPNSITFSGTANYTYNNETGVIQITNVQSDITIDIVCEMQTISLNSGYYLLPNIKTLYDFGTINIDVPEGMKLYQYTEQSLMGRYTPTEQETGYIGGYSYVAAEPYAVYTTLDTDYISNNQTSTTVWLNNQGKLIRTIKSDNLTIEFAGFWVIYIPSNSVVGITSSDFYNSLQSISNLNVIEQDLYYIIREFNNELATTATEKYNEGYAEGYDLGINTNIISDSTTSVITALFNGIFGTIFNIEIFPGFPLYILILIPIVFSMLGVIFWLIRGR